MFPLARNSEDRTMTATVNHFDRVAFFHLSDPGLPYFLDGIDIDGDDPVDWWLDLGSVDLTGVPGV
jgi:hypothetical protein